MEQLRQAALIVAVLGMAIVLFVAWNNRRRFLYITPAMLYLGHLGLFYLARILQLNSFLGIPLTPETINVWSATIHIQAAITITYKAIMMITSHRDIGGIDNA